MVTFTAMSNTKTVYSKITLYNPDTEESWSTTVECEEYSYDPPYPEPSEYDLTVKYVYEPKPDWVTDEMIDEEVYNGDISAD